MWAGGTAKPGWGYPTDSPGCLMTRTAPHNPLHPGTVTLPQGCLAQSSQNHCLLTVHKKKVNKSMCDPNKPLPQVTAEHWTLEALLGAPAAWKGQSPDPHTGDASSQTDGFPLSPPPALPQGSTEFPMLPSELLYRTQMNFLSRNNVLAVPAWWPLQENIHHFDCTLNQMFPMALLCSPIPTASWDMPGFVPVSFSSGKPPNFPFLGSLAENQISNKGAKALARSLLVNRSLMVLE